MAQPDEPFMSIRWDEEEDQPDTQVVSSDDLLLPASDPARRSSDMSSTLVAAPDNLSGFGGPNHVPDPYPTVPGAGRAALAAEHIDPPRWQGFLMVHVHDPRRVRASGAVAASSSAAIVDELPVAAAAANGGMVNGAGAKDAFVSYGIRTETNLAHFDHTRVSTRRRYRDFAFLHDALQRDLPACLVPPLPDKHRMEYVTGDRFSTEFVQRRTYDLQIFLERVCRHPTLMRTPILRSFLESNEWTVDMHAHLSASHQAVNMSATGDANRAPGLLDNWSDVIVNVFTRVKKLDERFVALLSDLDRFDEGVAAFESSVARGRSRAGDLSSDYEELSSTMDALAELEKGMSPFLRQTGSALRDFARLERLDAARSNEQVLGTAQALLSYGQAYKHLLRAREGKQVEFEELTEILSSVVAERERLASLASSRGQGKGPGASPGHGGVRGAGITGYLRDQMDALRGVDEERTRVERMQRLDARIRELQDTVAGSHGTLHRVSQQVLAEAALFEAAKQREMHALLTHFAQSRVHLCADAVQLWDHLLDSIGAGAGDADDVAAVPAASARPARNREHRPA